MIALTCRPWQACTPSLSMAMDQTTGASVLASKKDNRTLAWETKA
jgi:hypothetical protein